MNKVKKIIKINNNEKSLKVYFSEFEKLSNCKRIWISCKDDEKNIYVNLKIPVNFFIHLIGIQKLPMFKKIKNEHLINKIKKEKINFETITNSIKSLKKKKKNVNEIRNVNSKIIGLRNINSFEFEKIFKDFNYVSFNKNIIKKIFPFTSCDLCLIKKINNDEFILF
ncbi:MAG: hypothetical protein K2H56_00630, partial [Malacoplasma sp.]|nr:hypothetical protein [Malacoplasma sp.]